MNDFFDLDAPLFRFLTRVADMVILSLLTAFCPPLILLAPAGYALFARWVLEKKVFYQYLPDIDDGIDKENKDCSHQD